jgi:hypothetical protein
MPSSMEFNSATRINDLNKSYIDLYAVDNAIVAHRQVSPDDLEKLKELEQKRAKIAAEIAEYTQGKK